jgi:hypothetical protein
MFKQNYFTMLLNVEFIVYNVAMHQEPCKHLALSAATKGKQF